MLHSHAWRRASVSGNDYKTFPASREVLLGRAAFEPGSELACQPLLPVVPPGKPSSIVPIYILSCECPELCRLSFLLPELGVLSGILLSSKAQRKEFYFPKKPFLIFPMSAVPPPSPGPHTAPRWRLPTLLHTEGAPGPGARLPRVRGRAWVPVLYSTTAGLCVLFHFISRFEVMKKQFPEGF